MKYVIDSKVYETHINDEVHLYGLLHQLAFLAEKAKDEKDLENLVETAKRYGEIAEEKFAAWRIPGRYLVFGDRKDLAELKAAELTPLTAVLKEHDAKIREKQRAATADDPAYIISGSAFRMLVGDLFDLLAQYSFLRNRVVEVKTEKRLARLQKNLSGENPSIRRMYRRWGFAEDQVVTCYDILEATLRRAHLTPYDPEEAAEPTAEGGLEAPMNIDFKSLKSVNDDVVGWIYVEAVPDINYPVVHGEDNETYLHHTYEKNYNFAGTIFVDYENKGDFNDCNTIVYGHNMKNGSMFAQLKKFSSNSDTYEKSKYFWIFTPEKNYRYEIISAYTTGAKSDTYTLFKGPGEEFQEYLKKIRGYSEIQTDAGDLTVKDKIVTLSTCTGNQATRYVVQGRRVDALDVAQ